MLIVNPNIRITKQFVSKKYMLYSSQKNRVVMDIGDSLRNLLMDINLGKYKTRKEMEKVVSKEIIQNLFDKEIIVEAEHYEYNENILPDLKYDYPLSSLVIELTNACNLNCVHCYGKFGHPSNKHMLTYKNIVDLKEELDKLHTKEIRLSGGECLLHPDFEKIAIFFLKNGFRVGIYTNGYEYEKLASFLNNTMEYSFYVAVSLDGTKDFHNKIRGGDSYEKTIMVLNELEKYNNVEVLIETAISKVNISNIRDIQTFVKERYPNFEHSIFLISPINNCEVAFGVEELPQIRAQYQCLFDDYYQVKEGFMSHLFAKKLHRCYGGVTNGVLTADNKIKCCPIAQHDIFVMGELGLKSLSEIWEHPSEETLQFRSDYIKESIRCKKCSSRKKCGNKNCRVEAFELTGSWKNENPYTCMVVKGCL